MLVSRGFPPLLSLVFAATPIVRPFGGKVHWQKGQNEGRGFVGGGRRGEAETRLVGDGAQMGGEETGIFLRREGR